MAADYDSYELRRVGLLPFASVDPRRSRELQESFLTELSRSAPYEFVLLGEADLEEVELSEPHRRGWYRPETIIQMSRRYALDAVLFGQVTHERSFPPQRLGLQLDLVAAETGLVIWSGAVDLDAADPRVVAGLEALFDEDGAGVEPEEGWRYALLSPDRFGRFAAYQIARML